MKRPPSSSPRERGSNPRRIAGAALLVLAGAFIAMGSACSNQGEGERCEVNNNNDDCRTDEGLVCYPASQLRNAGSDRCCPVERSRATEPVCRTAGEVGDLDASPPPDTGPPSAPDAGAPETDDSDAGQ